MKPPENVFRGGLLTKKSSVKVIVGKQNVEYNR
jgi:hypothetical protein